MPPIEGAALRNIIHSNPLCGGRDLFVSLILCFVIKRLVPYLVQLYVFGIHRVNNSLKRVRKKKIKDCIQREEITNSTYLYLERTRIAFFSAA